MTATPFVPGRNGTGATDGPFQKIVAQLQDNDGNDYDLSNPLPIDGTALSAVYLKLDCSNDPLTGAELDLGSANLVTTGSGTFGSNHINGTYPAYFTDGTAEAFLSVSGDAGSYFDSGSNYTAYLGSNTYGAGLFSDGTRTIWMADGSYLLYGEDGSGAYWQMFDGTHYFYLTDGGGNSVSMFDGTYSLNVSGGDSIFGGAVTLSTPLTITPTANVSTIQTGNADAVMFFKADRSAVGSDGWRWVKGDNSERMALTDRGDLSIVRSFTAGNYIEGTQLIIEGTVAPIASFTYTAASASTGGAGMVGIQDDGAATASGHRLGYFLFGGAYDTSHTIRNTAGMQGFATELWSDGSYGTKIDFSTTPNGSDTRTTRLTIDQDGTVEFANEVGIGTAPEANHALKIQGGSDDALTILQGADRKGLMIYGYDDQSGIYTEWSVDQYGHGRLVHQGASNDNFYISTANGGIYFTTGTSGPAREIGFANSATGYTYFKMGSNDGTTSTQFQDSDSAIVFSVNSNGDLLTGATQDEIFDATTATFKAPNSYFDIVTPAAGWARGFRFRNNADSATLGGFWGNGGSGTISHYVMGATYDAAERFEYDAPDGDARIYGNRPELQFKCKETVGAAVAYSIMRPFVENDTTDQDVDADYGVYAVTNQGATPALRYVYITGAWDDTKFKFDPTNGLGLGISSSTRPSELLDIAGISVFDGSGHLGIKTTSPSYPLEIVMAATDDRAIHIDGNTDYTASGGTAYTIYMDRDINYGTGSIGSVYPFYSNIDMVNTDATIDGLKYWYIFYQIFDNDGTITNPNADDYTLTHRGTMFYLDEDGTYDTDSTGKFNVSRTCSYIRIDDDNTYLDTGGNTPANIVTQWGVGIDLNMSPTVTSGTWNFNTEGININISDHTGGNTNYARGINIVAVSGTQYAYGIVIGTISGSGVAYAVWDASGANWALDADNQKFIIGEGQDFEIFFDGSYGRLDATGESIYIGDDTTNAVEIKNDGEINLHGTARVWKSQDLKPANLTRPQSNPPGDTYYQEVKFDAYDDTTEEQLFYIWHVPNDFATGTGSVRGHFGGMVSNEAGAEYVAMGYEYWKFSPDDTFDISGAADGGGAVNITIANGEGNYVWHESATGTCDTTNWASGDIIVFRFFRDVDDTYTGGNPPYADDYTGDVLIGVYHLEYLVDKLGEAS